MKLIQSPRVPLPLIYLIENEMELFKIPLGIPYFIGNMDHYADYVRILEYQVLLSSARKTGLAFKWDLTLKDAGFSSHVSPDVDQSLTIKRFIKDGDKVHYSKYLSEIDYVVDVEYLKSLHVVPEFFSDLENNIKSNIVNSIMYNPFLYNKKHELMIGDVELNSQERNLIIIDISGSIPKSISKTCLLLSKTMSTSFFADLLITGSKSTLYEYENVHKLDINTIYDQNGMDNDQVYFKNLLSHHRKYNTAIVFGDEDNPSYKWSNPHNSSSGQFGASKNMTDEEGRSLNQWHIKKVLSLHKRSKTEIAGYARWFKKELVECVQKEWVKYLEE